MKVAVSQYKVKMLNSYQDFVDHVRSHVESAAQQGAELLLFPEFFTAELFTLNKTKTSYADMNEIFQEFARAYTEPLKQLFKQLALEYRMIIAAGTHFAHDERDEKNYNTCFLFSPHGDIYQQNKIHPSYELVYNKSMTSPAQEVNVFEINGIRYGISICYDGSFPEVARILTNLGADIILSPTCTLDEWGRSRNIMFSKARATENQVFVLNSHLIGSIPFPSYLPYGFTFTGQSGIYSPIHPALGTADGVIQCSEPNVETVTVGEVNVEHLRSIREKGHNSNRKDMRHEFYRQFEMTTT